MPELPEVETLRRELDREVVGKRIKEVDVRSMRLLKRHRSRKSFASRVEGVKITGVRRRGKYLILELDSGEWLVVHLGMSGQLRRHNAKDPVDKHTHLIFTFTQHGQLRCVDPRTFGEVFVVAQDAVETEAPELASLGFDPLEDLIPWTEFGRMLHARSVKLKAFLTDQSIVAGIGNIYADEILFEAGLRYDRPSDSLGTQEIRRLYRAMVEVLHEAVKYRGSTLPDATYVDLYGKPGAYQEHHRVYGKAGQACPRCRTTISRVRFQGRSTFLCEQCQM